MSWLLELLVDAIREMCSQFIVDMMELITNMFTELLSCNLSLFEELFSVVGSLYKNVIVPTGIAILLMILVWQLFKSMFGGKAGVNAEEPIELICRSAISLFLLAGSKPLVDYILRIAGTPYQWVVGTKVKVASFSGYVSTLEGVTDTLGISSLSISVLMLIMQFVVAWNYFKMLMVIAEHGGSAICATQDLADCFAVRDGKLGRGILSNSKTKIVLNMEVSEAERIQEELDLSEAETNSIIHFERGNGLISTNNNNLIVEFKASALEKDLITTDRKDLQELKDRIRKYGTDAYGRK